MTSTRFLCFRRAFLRRWAIGWPNRFVEFIGQPVFVAVVVCLAFLAKEQEGRLAAFSSPFFYFTGLYAFWVGLFGSCQSLNGEVQNGEWSYWTLGCRRNIPRHVGSIFGVNLVCSLWTVVVFLVTIVGVAGILALRPKCEFNPFISMFLTQSNSTADSLWQAGYILKPLLVAKWGSWGPLLFAVGLYGLSLLAATVCGVCFGMLLSTVFPDPSVSLQASVAFVVLLGMLSLLGLQGDKSRGANNSALDRAFAPRLEACFAATTKTDDAAVNFLIGFSRILPQRYFFNISRMPFEKSIDSTVIDGIKDDLNSRCHDDTECKNGWWLKDEPTKVNDKLSSCWGITLPSTDNADDFQAVAKYIKADKQFEQKHRLDLYPKLLSKAVWMELTPLVWMCLVCLLIVNVLVLQLPQYRQLR